MNRTHHVMIAGLLLLGVLSNALCERPALGEGPKTRAIADDARRLGRGLNIGNHLETPKGADWSIRIDEGDFAMIRAAGFDTVRLPVKWSAYSLDQAPYTIEADLFRRVDRLLAAAEAAGLNAVLNSHHFDELDSAPLKSTEKLVGLWRQIAQRYRDRSGFLYFELNNEPHDKLTADLWNRILLKGLLAIRETNPTRPVIVGPVEWNNIYALSKLQLPEDQRLIVTVHFYDPYEFTHQSAEWAEPRIRDSKNVTWAGTNAERAKLKQQFDLAAEWGRQQQRPIFVGEFGAYGKGPLESRVRWTAAVAREAEQHGFSWAYWEFAAGFGVYDRAAGQWRKDLLGALIPPKP